MIFTCYICGVDFSHAQMYEDLIGNQIYICEGCSGERMHRIRYRYRYLPKGK